MKTPIFNIHDLALVLTFVNCLTLAVFQLFLTGQGKAQSRLLALFFINQALATVTTLLHWSEPLQSLVAPNTPVLIFLLHLSYIAQGPLLYLYASSLVNRSFAPGADSLRHAGLVVAYALAALVTYMMLRLTGDPALAARHRQYQILLESLHLFQRLVVLGYGLMCIQLIRRYSRALRESVSDAAEPRYLWILLIGFCLSWFWALLTHLSYYTLTPQISDLLGIANNYLNFALLLALFALSVIHAGKVQARDLRLQKPATPEPQLPPEAIDRVLRGVDEQKLYLETSINIETFSERIGLSVRETSAVINRHLNTNFFEFINSRRVEAARALLAAPEQSHKSVTDILLECGFNSKTAFNRFFKRVTGITPSQYRQKALEQHPAPGA